MLFDKNYHTGKELHFTNKMDILLNTGAFLGCSTRIRILNLQLKKGTPN